MSYKLSTDYERLYEKVNNGMEVAAFVDYSSRSVEDHICRDICTIKKKDDFHIQFSARGISYGGVYYYDETKGGDEKDYFIRECDRMNLEWIPAE